jgi:hypothetical protein
LGFGVESERVDLRDRKERGWMRCMGKDRSQRRVKVVEVRMLKIDRQRAGWVGE